MGDSSEQGVGTNLSTRSAPHGIATSPRAPGPGGDLVALAPIPTAVLGADGRIRAHNAALEQMVGTAARGRRWSTLFLAPPALDGDLRGVDLRVGSTGGAVWARAWVTPLTDEPGARLLQLVDVSDEHRRVEGLRHRADHDELTGLWRRSRLRDELRILVVRPPSSLVAVVRVDVERLGEVNRAQGHTTGDAVLRAVAHVLRTPGPTTVGAARIGGAELAMVIHGLRGPQLEGRLAEIRTALAALEVRDASGQRVAVTTSTGAAPVPVCAHPERPGERDAAVDRALDAAEDAVRRVRGRA